MRPVFWSLHLMNCLSPFHLALFLEFWSVLSFGPCSFISSFWQPPCLCFCVSGRAALTPCLWCSRCPVGYSGTASHVIQAGYLRCTFRVGWLHPPLAVEPWLLLVDEWEGFTLVNQRGWLSVTTDHQPLPSVEDRRISCAGASWWWFSSMICSCPWGALALGILRWCGPRSAPTCILPGVLCLSF